MTNQPSPAEIIAKWPDWKKGLLEASMKSTNSKPRPPVESGHQQQPSPVLTAEEREVLTFKVGDRVWKTNADGRMPCVVVSVFEKLGRTGAIRYVVEGDSEDCRGLLHIASERNLLSRTADPDTVTLPREAVQEFANALYGAVKDIGEWVQLAKRQRREMFLPDCNPLCPTDAAISASDRRTLRACKAVAAISDLLPEDPQAQGGDDERAVSSSQVPNDAR